MEYIHETILFKLRAKWIQNIHFRLKDFDFLLSSPFNFSLKLGNIYIKTFICKNICRNFIGVGGEFSNNQIRVLLKVGTALTWKLKAWGGQWILPVKVTTEFKASKTTQTKERTKKSSSILHMISGGICYWQKGKKES